MCVRAQHGGIAVAGEELDCPVLPGLETRGLPERIPELGIFVGIIVRSTSQALLSCSKMRATRDSISKVGSSRSARSDRIAELISCKASFIHSSDV
jgi:hypothetical protein